MPVRELPHACYGSLETLCRSSLGETLSRLSVGTLGNRQTRLLVLLGLLLGAVLVRLLVTPRQPSSMGLFLLLLGAGNGMVIASGVMGRRL
jgi:uncharacterized membrane protein YbjE (DUF340 family)